VKTCLELIHIDEVNVRRGVRRRVNAALGGMRDSAGNLDRALTKFDRQSMLRIDHSVRQPRIPNVRRRSISLVVHCLLATAFVSALAHVGCAETVRFVVGRPPGLPPEFYFDSYVLPLSEPEDIAHARDLIEFGPAAGATIAVAAIAAGGDGINRNSFALFAPEWSWHVTDFLGFADITAEILDGWPTGVELYPEFWIGPSGQGTIGFWSYTVVAELPPGDFNADFTVALDDYSLWKETYGSASRLGADGNGDGSVTAADYTVWRNHLGAVSDPLPYPLASASAVPEPPAWPAIAVAAIIASLASGRRRCCSFPARLRRPSGFTPPQSPPAPRPEY
jgi:hypothetical protein